ncbi:carbamoyl phosphate synthase-like protein [Legionella busanensis]|uniref:Carbamoyl phosphate synthase-like protein n=1 Tax=Legionella busanensis TaxID=190655 RepID=A0A378JJY9_9GAMM|nr:ATP-grasp domain-containing protein [Legionella busanensis]STX51387.1 carbamoyl phosphate synthase-like protein [Legionella busanensis]
MKKILFTGGGGAGTEALWRFLSQKYDLFFADASLDSIDNRISNERKLSLPMAHDKNFISEVQKLITNNKINILVPGVDEELIPLAKNRGMITSKIFAPSMEFIQLMLDKLECFIVMNKHGLPVPKTVPLADVSELKFPLIVKPRTGRGSRGVCLVQSISEIEAYKVLYKTDLKHLIAQEFISGDEYTVMVAGDDNGNLKAIVPVKVKQKKGITIQAHIELNQLILNYVHQFHKIFRPSCIYNIQCILTPDNIVLPFEINPRISTTFCLSIASGFDPFSSEQEKKTLFLPEAKLFLKRNWTNCIFSE